ncbi:MAG TPA: hypothetical protein VKP88_04220 [Candidatus Paceibacterota bacterium]|nr:hypothetical protein [Candidatus Paceibacterota bacterium]
MASTHFSGPIKAGPIREGDDTNVGFAVMAQTKVIDIAGADATTTIGTVPAGSKILYVVLNVTTANDDGTASTVVIGISGDTNAFLSSTSVQSAGVTFSDTMAATSHDVGTSDVDVIATFAATDEDGTAGVADATVVYLQNTDLL